MMSRRSKQSGFTLIELMVATVVFSVVLLVILASFLQVGRMYYKGISYSNTQESARRVSQDLTNDIRFNSTNVYQHVGTAAEGHQQIGTSNSYYFCVGNHRYVYTLFEKLTSGNIDNRTSGIQQTTVEDCVAPGDEVGTEHRQLLGIDMQLNRFAFVCNDSFCNVGLHIIFYGADSLVFASNFPTADTPAEALVASDAYCTGALISSQFCAAVDLNTSILRRQ